MAAAFSLWRRLIVSTTDYETHGRSHGDGSQAARLVGKHLPQNGESLGKGRTRQMSEATDEPAAVHGSKLVQD